MDPILILTFFIMLGLSIFSGMAGGGAGVVVIPYFIAIGLPPANALATARVGGLGTALGSLTAFKGKGLLDRKYLKIFIAITLVSSLIAAWAIPRIDAEIFQKIIGVILLLMIPTVFLRNASLQPGKRTQRWIGAGFVAFTMVSILTSMFGTGVGMLLNLVLMFLFGMDALRASATKRAVQGVMVGSSRVDLQACKLEYSIVSPK